MTGLQWSLFKFVFHQRDWHGFMAGDPGFTLSDRVTFISRTHLRTSITGDSPVKWSPQICMAIWKGRNQTPQFKCHDWTTFISRHYIFCLSVPKLLTLLTSASLRPPKELIYVLLGQIDLRVLTKGRKKPPEVQRRDHRFDGLFEFDFLFDLDESDLCVSLFTTKELISRDFSFPRPPVVTILTMIVLRPPNHLISF